MRFLALRSTAAQAAADALLDHIRANLATQVRVYVVSLPRAIVEGG